MSLGHGASIVRDGLVLHLDAANPKSYPGSGTTWYDLSGNSNHFTLINSPAFSGSYFGFDGVDDYARSINNLDLSSYGSVTVEITMRVNSTTGPSGMAFEHSSNWNTSSMGFGLVPNSSGFSYVSNSHHTNQLSGAGVLNYSGIIGTDIITHTNVWSRVAEVQRTAYINTAVRGSKVTSAYPSFRNDVFYISSRAGTTLFANHRVYDVKVYGRALSESEIKQNFEALRGRYGI